jgi:tetratricopeptide (TPR) repeat protein
MTRMRPTIEYGAAIAAGMRDRSLIRMSTDCAPQAVAIARAIALMLTLALAGTARAASGPVVALLDEESVPAAENPGAPVLDGSASETNPGPSADWERVPVEGAPPSSAKAAAAPAAKAAGAAAPASSTTAASSADGATSAAPAARADAGASAQSVRAASRSMKPAAQAQAQPAAPAAPVASVSVQHAPAGDTDDAASGAATESAETGGAGEQEANLGPPPALDLGAMQSGRELSSISLADEFKMANTPARVAALRVTEQARVELAAGKIDDALRDLGRAVSIDPGNPFEYFYLGRAYIARGNYAQALTFFQRAEIGFGTRPDWLGETVGFEGACDEELARNTAGALAYRRALGSAPNNLRARVGYSRLSGYLPRTATADESAATGPANEALPPPERTAAEPPPEEGSPPPPPEPVTPEGGAQKIPAGDYQPD